MLCGACEGGVAEKYRVDGHTLAGLAALSAAEARTRVALPDQQARAVNRLLTYHIAQQLGKPLKMARHVLAGNDKQVDGCLRVDILDGHHPLVLIDEPGGGLMFEDATEDAGFHGMVIGP